MGDINFSELKNGDGWITFCVCDQIFTFVSIDEVEEAARESFEPGLLGRSKRDKDAQALVVVHVSDNRET